MKLFLFACLLALAAGRPDRDAQTIIDERSDSGDGNFNYRFETTNGLNEERVGVPGIEGQSNMQGSYTIFLEDGTPVVITYIADENGYRASSDALGL